MTGTVSAEQQVSLNEYTAWFEARKQWSATLRERMRQIFSATWSDRRKE